MSKNTNHQKHAKLTKPSYGVFHRNEWAIIGTPCDKLQQFAHLLIQRLTTSFKTAYVDADHPGENTNRYSDFAMEAGTTLRYTDKITHHRFDLKAQLNTYRYRMLFNEQDLVFVNGNHFKAQNQIVILDPKKEASLSRKLDRLTDVKLILSTEKVKIPYDFLKLHLKGQDIPIIEISNIDQIISFLKESMKERQAILKGLVLAGGKSQRMGRDKGAISYYDKPQREHVAQLVSQFCESTYLSIRQDQNNKLDSQFPLLPDAFNELGPFGAILSAFKSDPNAAWLVVACDLPLLDKKTLQQLVDHRNTSEIATAFNSPHNTFPEPLITIWEPRSYPILLQFMAQGYSCPRKVLINSSVKLIDPDTPRSLINVNHPEEYEQVMQLLNSKNRS